MVASNVPSYIPRAHSPACRNYRLYMTLLPAIMAECCIFMLGKHHASAPGSTCGAARVLPSGAAAVVPPDRGSPRSTTPLASPSAVAPKKAATARAAPRPKASLADVSAPATSMRARTEPPIVPPRGGAPEAPAPGQSSAACTRLTLPKTWTMLEPSGTSAVRPGLATTRSKGYTLHSNLQVCKVDWKARDACPQQQG